MENRTKLDELKERQHKHDVTIKTSAGVKTISDKEWLDILTNEGANMKPPEFTLTGAIALSSLLAAAEGEKITRQYGTQNEAHFGFTFRSIEDISVLEEMFKTIDKLTFAAATNGESDAFDLSFGGGFVGNDVEEVVVEAHMMDKLNWMFNEVQFLCGDMLRDAGLSTIQFCAVTAEKNGIILGHWMVTADYVTKMFGDSTVTISDDGMAIRFSPAVPTVGEIYSEDDNFCLTSFYEAIKNLVTDMRYEES